MHSAFQNRDFLAFVLVAPLFLHGQQNVTHSARLDLRYGVPLVHVFLNHRGPYTFVVDTATTSPAIVSPKVASDLGLKTEGKKTLTDLQGGPGRLLDIGKLESLEIAGVEIKAVPAIVNQLPGTARHYDGIVGLELFRDYLVTLDFPDRQLQVTAGALSMEEHSNVIPCQTDMGIPTIMLRFQAYEVKGAIDTGAPGLIIPESLAKHLTFVESPELIAVDETQAGKFQVKGARMAGDIHLATFRFERPYIGISSAVRVANLGAEVFLDFILTIDKRNQLVRFWSRKPTHRLGHATKHEELQLPADALAKTVMRTGAPY
jgi:predicted aspartyl protease